MMMRAMLRADGISNAISYFAGILFILMLFIAISHRRNSFI